jgi:hypothetical protein
MLTLFFLLLRGGKALPQDQKAEKVNDAIDRGVEYLLGEIGKQQNPDWPEPQRVVGQVALETYALVVAGVDVNHPLIKKNFDYLRDHALATGYTYTLACYVFALDAAIAQKEADLMLANPELARSKFMDNPAIGQEYRGPLSTAVQKVVSLQKGFGGWIYSADGNSKSYDNSNTQFAVLALGVGYKRGVPIESGVWEKVMSHFLKQAIVSKDEVKDRLTLMAGEEVAGRKLRGRTPKEKVDVEVVSKEKSEAKSKEGSEKEKKGEEKNGEKKPDTVVVPKTMVGRPAMPEIGTENITVYQRSWKYNDDKGEGSWNMTCAGISSLLLARQALKGKLPLDRLEALNEAIRDGFGWIMVHWSSSPNYYGIYSLEKVADLGEVKRFGSHDWYEEISSTILGGQQPNGGWSGEWNARVCTSFALLVLNRATALITMSLVSQNPLKRIMVSGRKSNADEPNDRTWVYVRDLDTTIHYPTLLRMIKRRSHPKLLQFLSSIVHYYPDEWKGELVPDMAAARDGVTQPDARKAIEGYLSEITGHKYERWEDYLGWYKRWERVIQIGTKQKQERVSDLLNYYQHTTKSFPLKKSVMWALVQCKARDAIPFFLKDLKSNDPKLRVAAYDAFKAFFVDFPPPFDGTGTQTVRDKQVEAILTWFDDQTKAKKN